MTGHTKATTISTPQTLLKNDNNQNSNSNNIISSLTTNGHRHRNKNKRNNKLADNKFDYGTKPTIRQ